VVVGECVRSQFKFSVVVSLKEGRKDWRSAGRQAAAAPAP